MNPCHLKYSLISIFCCLSLFCPAQKNIPTTEAFLISGEIKTELTVTLDDLRGYAFEYIPSVIITSHTGVVKDTLTDLKGVLLRTILEDIEIISESPKRLSEYYVTLIASDGYKDVFSWNEIFNSSTGEFIYVIIEQEGVPVQKLEDRIAAICISDLQTGRRYVKGLEKVVIRKTV